ncbi:hypothetical protein KGA65_15505 [Ideonella sp. B7]|uniref:hypothetical protein n=1 Tax=Ideonella benzenivorans TaxID=2831643 RepID=UPI001CED2C1A|nr:hypothetical protein [Ideonella benzenivorans]MCA6217939.1 hypothetical protein [Ideonella benzenivorans]
MPKVIIGSYALAQMRSMKGLTFPRVHLYNANGVLIDRSVWPHEFEEVRDHAGQAFCCVSDKPSSPGGLGPPPDCKRLVYGENVLEHFTGLRDPRGQEISYPGLPKHRYLVVEYYADWCAPCQPARQALQRFLTTPAAGGYLALVVDFSKLQS